MPYRPIQSTWLRSLAAKPFFPRNLPPCNYLHEADHLTNPKRNKKALLTVSTYHA